MPDCGGFTFCGVPVKNVGLEYSPELSQTYVYRPTTSNIMADTFEAHDGGYYYGHARQPKVFTLKCYYFLTEIRSGLMKNVYDLFRIGKRGKLVFDKRDWLYYEVVITKINSEEMYNHLNGIITIEATAYEPYGYTDTTYSQVEDVKLNSNIPNTSKELITLAGSLPTTSQAGTSTIELINYGTEPSPLIFGYKSNTDNTNAPAISMYSQTTNQLLEMYACTFSSAAHFLYIDGQSGKVYTAASSGVGVSPAFYYHKRGFITLVPADRLTVKGSLASDGTITLTNEFAGDPSDLIGRKISINYNSSTTYAGHITAATSATITTDITGYTIGGNNPFNIYKTNLITLTVPDSGVVRFLDRTKYRFS